MKTMDRSKTVSSKDYLTTISGGHPSISSVQLYCLMSASHGWLVLPMVNFFTGASTDYLPNRAATLPKV
jgi:hypothetical protein